MDLEFTPCPVSALPPKAAVIKVAVLKADAIKITLSATAYEKLGRPKGIEVKTASHGGDNYLRISAQNDGTGWPVTARTTPEGGRGGTNKRLSAFTTLRSHPFEPGVTHQAQEVEAKWSDDAVVITMPDWKAMLARIEDSVD